MGDELERFVAALAIPDDRKAVVLAELSDHVACVTEAAVREGRDPESAARSAIGCLEMLRGSLEAVEPAFRTTRMHALVRGVVGGALVALLIDRGGELMRGGLGALAAIAIAVVCAPPRVLELLRAELRAPRIRGAAIRGVAIGPALTYGYTVLSTPFIVWIAMIVVRAFEGVTTVDVPLAAFAVLVVVYAVLAVEMIRARRKAIA